MQKSLFTTPVQAQGFATHMRVTGVKCNVISRPNGEPSRIVLHDDVSELKLSAFMAVRMEVTQWDLSTVLN